MSHYTQQGRKHCTQLVKDMIVRNGGWTLISEEIGEKPFAFKVSDELGCSLKKAEEYLTHVIQVAMVEARLEALNNEKR